MKRPLLVAILASGSTTGVVARGDVADDVATVTARLGPSGSVVVLPPRLLASHESIPLALPPPARPAPNGCTTVIALGAASTVFGFRIGAHGESPAEAIGSAGGAAMVARCGAARAALSDLTLEMRSPRAIVELLVAESAASPPALATLLPNREPGVVPPPERPGPPPHPGPLEERLRQFEEGLVRDGAQSPSRRAVRADDEGAGKVLLEFSPGCHRIGIFSAEDGNEVHDIDADLTWISGELAASERTESPDATLFACTSVRDLGLLTFAGASAGGTVVFSRGRFELPAKIPDEFGREATSALAWAFAEHHIPSPNRPPSYESFGVAGLTTLVVPVEPGRCYAAGLGLVEGKAKLIALDVAVSEGPSEAHAEASDDAAALTFCAGAVRRMTLSAEVHGAALAWALGLWPLSSRRLGEEAP